jgi:hypothetical protein
MSALRLLNETTVSSGVALVNVTDIFTTEFEVYQVVGANFLGATSTATGTNLRLINAGGGVIADDYMYAQQAMKAETSFGENRSEDESRIWNVMSGIDDSGQASGGDFWIFNPVSSSNYTWVVYESSGSPGGNFRGYKGIACYPKNIAITGFQIENNEGVNFSGGGSLKTFGLRVDS